MSTPISTSSSAGREHRRPSTSRCSITPPGDIEDVPYFREHPLRIGLDDLAAVKDDVEEYGRRLGALLFEEQGRVLLDRAMAASESMPVNIRLLVDPKAPLGYQAIRWETIRGPGSGDRLTTSNNIRFSRYLSNPESRQATPLARMGRLNALAVVANPSDIADYSAGTSRLAAADEITRLVPRSST
jgi:hypothetical protein